MKHFVFIVSIISIALTSCTESLVLPDQIDDCRWNYCPEEPDTIDPEYKEYLLWSRDHSNGDDDFWMSTLQLKGNSFYYSSSAGSNHLVKVNTRNGLEYWKWDYQFRYAEDVYVSSKIETPFICVSNRIVLIDDFVGDWSEIIEEEEYNVREEGYLGQNHFYRAAYKSFYGSVWNVARLPLENLDQREILFSINSQEYGASRLIIDEMVEWQNPNTGDLHLFVDCWLSNSDVLLVNYNVSKGQKEWELVNYIDNPNNNYNPNIRELRMIDNKLFVVNDHDILAIDPVSASIDWSYYSEGSGINSRTIDPPVFIPSRNALLTISSGYEAQPQRVLIDIHSGQTSVDNLSSSFIYRAPIYYKNYILNFFVPEEESWSEPYTLEVLDASDFSVLKSIELPNFGTVTLSAEEDCLILDSGKEFFVFDLLKIVAP